MKVIYCRSKLRKAVDLLNIIRPTVALTVWIALMGHALFSTTTIYQALKQNFSELQDSFIQELRRFYPFFPMMPAISLQDVVVDGYLIPKDSWVVQDIYGTNHDPRTFDQPDDFKWIALSDVHKPFPMRKNMK